MGMERDSEKVDELVRRIFEREAGNMKKIKNLKMMWKFSDETGNYEVSMPMLAVKFAGCVIALFSCSRLCGR